MNDESATVEETEVARLGVDFVLGAYSNPVATRGAALREGKRETQHASRGYRPLSFKSNQLTTQNHDDKAHNLTTWNQVSKEHKTRRIDQPTLGFPQYGSPDSWSWEVNTFEWATCTFLGFSRWKGPREISSGIGWERCCRWAKAQVCDQALISPFMPRATSITHANHCSEHSAFAEPRSRGINSHMARLM